jgi:hypothetical protein
MVDPAALQQAAFAAGIVTTANTVENFYGSGAPTPSPSLEFCCVDNRHLSLLRLPLACHPLRLGDLSGRHLVGGDPIAVIGCSTAD